MQLYEILNDYSTFHYDSGFLTKRYTSYQNQNAYPIHLNIPSMHWSSKGFRENDQIQMDLHCQTRATKHNVYNRL